MNIAIFPSAFHPSLGGVEELSRQLAHELVKRGHKVIVLTNRWPRDLPSFEVYEGIPLYRLPFRTPEPLLKARITHFLTSGLIHRQVRDLLLKHKIDVIHVQCVSSNAHYAQVAAKELNIPLVVTLQGELTMDVEQIFQRSDLARQTLRDAMLGAQVVTACSRKTLTDAESFLNIDTAERGRVVFNAAKIGDFANAEKRDHSKPYIFALGRMVPQKGFDILLQALALSTCPYDLLLAGDGVEVPKLKALSSQLGLDKRVYFIGKADRRTVASCFKGCEFVVVPSTADEGLPVVCAEALAAGKTVLSTESGGAPEAIIHEVNGLIVPKGDVKALVDGLNRLSHDEVFRAKAERLNLERAQLFDWETVTSGYEQAYQDSIASYMTLPELSNQSPAR